MIVDNAPERHDRFAEADADVETGSPWLYRDPDAPNPLTIQATGWSTGHTKFGEAESLAGVDRDGKNWSVLVGGVVLTKKLVEGLVEEWDNDRGTFVVVATRGRVEPGEIVSLKYVGDVEGAKYTYPNFKISRKPPAETTQRAVQAAGDWKLGDQADTDIPW